MNPPAIRLKFTAAKTFWLFIGMVILSIILRETPLINCLLWPFTLFETMLHESSHALACIFTGGWVDGLTIVEDGNGHGGLTYAHGGIPFIFSQAGYMGEALWGSLLISLSRFPRLSRYFLMAIGVGIGIVSILFMPQVLLRSPLQAIGSLFWGLAIAAGLVWSGRKFSDKWAHLMLTFIAAQALVGSFFNLYALLLQACGVFPNTWSDATNMARLTGIPAVVWGVWWATFSLGVISFTLWRTFQLERGMQKTEAKALATESVPLSIPAPQATSAGQKIDTSAQIEKELLELRRQSGSAQSVKIDPKQNAEQKRKK